MYQLMFSDFMFSFPVINVIEADTVNSFKNRLDAEWGI